MRKLAPYLIFGVAYFVLVLMAGITADEMSNEMASQVLGLVAPIAVAPIAIVVAKRVGSPSTFGVFVVTILSALSINMIITVVYSALAARVGGSVPFLSLAHLGGWSFALSNLIYVMTPVLWLQLLKGHDSRNAQANTVA